MSVNDYIEVIKEFTISYLNDIEFGEVTDLLTKIGQEYRYKNETAGIQSSAIGMAKLYLHDGNVHQALQILEEASDACEKVLRDLLIERGVPAEVLDKTLL